MVWKLDNKIHASGREAKEEKFLKSTEVVVGSKPGLGLEKGGERSLERNRRSRRRRRGERGGEKKTGKEKKTSLNSNLQKFIINIRVSKKNEFSPLFWHPVSLQI